MVRRPARSVAANPVLVGAVTVLVVVVGVVLAYQANRGLPFAPTYEVSVELPDAAGLVPGAEVRLAGSRAGAVDRLEAVQRRDGSVGARAVLRLDPDAGPLRTGSSVVVRPRSLLGLKYVELVAGDARAPALRTGSTLPVRRATPQPVDLDEVLSVFDERTRENASAGLRELGTALAGRGSSLNEAIGRARSVLEPLERVGRRLSAPGTRWERLLPALGRVAADVAPVAESQAGFFTGGSRVFGALDRASAALDDALAQGPQTLDVAVRELPRQRPLLADLRGLVGDLRGGSDALRTSGDDLAAAVSEGTPGLRESIRLSAGLAPTFSRLDRFVADDRTTIGLRSLTQAADALAPLTSFVTPAQTTCNLVGLLLRNVSSLLSEGGATGTWQRFNILAAASGPNNEGGSASAPAAGPGPDNFLHTNPYPNTAAPGQPRECEAGNEPYSGGRQAIGTVPGRQGSTEVVEGDGR